MNELTWDEVQWGDHLRFGKSGPDIDTALTYTVMDRSPGPRKWATLQAYRLHHPDPVMVRLTPPMLAAHGVTRPAPWLTLAMDLWPTFSIETRPPRPGLRVATGMTGEGEITSSPVGRLDAAGELMFTVRGDALIHSVLRVVAQSEGWPLTIRDDFRLTSVEVEVSGSFGSRVVSAHGYNTGERDALILARAIRLACELQAADRLLQAQMMGQGGTHE